ncbi:MAG: pilus assembly protein [Alphaproteobacteria bacterium]|nr:pilus assembly protein [Alphaproteobacteria bacterium]
MRLGFWGSGRWARLSDCNGNAAVEFALVSPILLAFLLGIISYGGYFWLAHNVQELANDAARAAIAGLDGAERTSLAQDSLNSEIADYGALSPQKVRAEYRGSGEAFTVSIAYDASGSAFWEATGLIPMPSSTITRSASVRLGGF